MNIVIGSDHAGYKLKETVKNYLKSKGFEVTDVGTDSTESVDYPDYAEKVASKVGQGDYPLGVLICGSGAGMAMAANKVKGVRAALAYNKDSAELARQHNNANILTIGARLTDEKTALDVTDAFFSAEFEGGRHQRRIDKISKIEESM